ncbi:MAG: TIGR03643 family protein [Bacteroidota bacterium]|nr:TIGR03643 family protein [Bacteroidota bacterium]
MVEQDLICAYSGLPSLASYITEKGAYAISKSKTSDTILNQSDKDRIIQMAWEDRTPFEAIEFQFGLKEKDVIEFMRKHSLPSSFRMWRKRMNARKTKHKLLRAQTTIKFKSNSQRGTGNKISKRL